MVSIVTIIVIVIHSTIMTYYILLPNDSEQDVINDINILGEYQSLNNTFHTQQGFQVFMKLINSYPDKLKDVRIKTSSNESLTITEFLDVITGYSIV